VILCSCVWSLALSHVLKTIEKMATWNLRGCIREVRYAHISFCILRKQIFYLFYRVFIRKSIRKNVFEECGGISLNKFSCLAHFVHPSLCIFTQINILLFWPSFHMKKPLKKCGENLVKQTLLFGSLRSHTNTWIHNGK